jgi:FG-GAP repeat
VQEPPRVLSTTLAISRAGYVKVFDGANPGSVLRTFNSYHAGDAFGWRVAAGDVTGDGSADVVVSASAST